MGRVRGPTHFGDPHRPQRPLREFRHFGCLSQIGDELPVVQLATVRMDREDVERCTEFHRATDERQIDAGGGTAQHVGLRIRLLMAA